MAQESIALHRRLTSKFVAMALLFFLAPQVFLYFFASNTASDVLIDSLRDDLKEKSFLVGADIDRFFSQRERDVRILSQADVLEGTDTNAIIGYLTEIIKKTPYLNDIDVIDIDGVIIASSGEQNEKGKHILELHPSLKSLFNDARTAQQGEVFVSGILKLDSGPGLAFLTPITDDANIRVIKVLLVEINLDIVKKIVADFDDRVIGNKFVYLVDNAGRVIVSADPETGLLTPYPDLSVQPKLLENFSQQGDVGSIIYEDVKKELVMAGFADMAEFGVNKAMDWSIIAVAPIADIKKPVDGFKQTMLIFMLSVSSVGIILMIFTSRGIVRSVANLVDGARKVGGGDINFRIDPGPADEFGYLARTINQTLDSLVSAIRRVEQSTTELRAAQDELLRKERLAAIGQVTATVGHELRNPLGALRSALAVVRKLAPDKTR